MPPVFVLADGRRVAPQKSVVSLGGDAACDVVVGGAGVRPSHALAYREGDGWCLVPAAPGCEIRVNGRRVRSAALKPGDTVALGSARIEIAAPAERSIEAAGRGGVLQALAGFAARLLAQRPPRELLLAALDGLRDVANADAGFVVSADGNERRLLASIGEVPESVVADGLVDRVLASGAPVLVADLASDAALAAAPSLAALRIASAVAVPLRAPGAPVSVAYLGRRLGSPPFESVDLEAATALSSLAALLLAASRELSELRAEVEGFTQRAAAAMFEGLVGESPPMRDLVRKIERIGPTRLNVVVTGETGTGKELVARALHRRSGRRGRFVPLHCGAIPRDLVERELFGHVRGAFSGAGEGRPGVFEAADGGTLFLDEIGEMAPDLQVRLLRAIQEHEVTRLGDTVPRKVDVRAVAATHVDLAAAVARGAFRQDLLFRLDEVRLDVPPLRARGEDVLLIAHRALALEGRRGLGFTQKAAWALRGHPFAGNVRELLSMVRRAVALAKGDLVGPADLGLGGSDEPIRPLEEAKAEFVRRTVREAVARCGGNKKDAAEALGIGLRSIFRYLDEGA